MTSARKNCAETLGIKLIKEAHKSRFKINISKCLDLINAGADVNAHDEFGTAVIITATINGHVKLVRALLDHGALPEYKKENGETESVLHVASAWAQGEIIDMLIARGANVDTKDKDGNTPLYWAVAAWSHLSALHLLLHGADPDSSSGARDNDTPRKLARTKQDTRMSRILDSKSEICVAFSRRAEKRINLIAYHGSKTEKQSAPIPVFKKKTLPELKNT